MDHLWYEVDSEVSRGFHARKAREGEREDLSSENEMEGREGPEPNRKTRFNPIFPAPPM